jgi:hypothetical protein
MSFLKLTLFIVLLFMPGLTWARGTAGVVNGVHNLSKTGVDPWNKTEGSSMYVTLTDQICVFCHTPHGGSMAGALWNKGDPGSSWRNYNSATMSIDTGVSPLNRTPNAEYMICLSCHDGSISVNHVINLPNDRDGATIKTEFSGSDESIIYNDMSTGGPGRRIGASWASTFDSGDLSDDHPISFSYNQVLSSDDYKPGGFKEGELNDVTSARDNGNGVEFFTTFNNVECPSCHDPHVDYISDPAYEPFLIMPNSNSDLCLACHNK